MDPPSNPLTDGANPLPRRAAHRDRRVGEGERLKLSPLARLLAADLAAALDSQLRDFRPFVVQQEETDMADNPQPSSPTWPGTGPTPPQPHPATGVPEQNP